MDINMKNYTDYKRVMEGLEEAKTYCKNFEEELWEYLKEQNQEAIFDFTDGYPDLEEQFHTNISLYDLIMENMKLRIEIDWEELALEIVKQERELIEKEKED